MADAAEVDAALMRYYFGDKRRLFEAVFRRRGPDVNAVRLAAMNEYRKQAGDQKTLEGLLTAFVVPSLQWMAEAPGHRNYGAIVAFVNSSRGYFHDLMSEVFDPVSRMLLSDMRALLPEVELEDIYWGYHMLTGAYTFSLGQTGRIDTLSDGRCSSDDLFSIAERLPVVLALGIEGMCQRRLQQKLAAQPSAAPQPQA